MVPKVFKSPAAAVIVLALSACSGGGSNSPGSPNPGGRVTPQKVAVSVSLFVPKPKAGLGSDATSTPRVQSAKKRLYLPTSVNSVSMQQTESAGSPVTGAPVVILVIGGPNCSPATGGQICTVTTQAALGVDAWAFSSYTSGNGSGTAVSINTGTITVLQGVANVLALTLNPILAALAFAPVAYSQNATAAITLPLVLKAMDTTGAQIIGPGTYVTAANVALPITLATSSSAIALQTIAGAAATLTLTTTASNNLGQFVYNGSLLAGTQTVTASATGIPTATMTLTLTVPSGGLAVPTSIALGENLGTTSTPLAISEPGFGGSFTLTGPSCAGIVTFPATAGPGPSTSATVTQSGGGTCTILVSDGTNSGSVTVYSTTFGIVLQ